MISLRWLQLLDRAEQRPDDDGRLALGTLGELVDIAELDAEPSALPAVERGRLSAFPNVRAATSGSSQTYLNPFTASSSATMARNRYGRLRSTSAHSSATSG